MKTMKRLITICLALALLAGSAAAAESEKPRIILYTCYTYEGPEGLHLQAGCVDEDGGLWTLDRLVPDYDWSTGIDEYLSALLEAGELTPAGRFTEFNKIDMFDLNGLIVCTEDQGNETEAVCEGAGAESSYAIVRDDDGNTRKILLGVSGDSRFENTDPNAQALYRLLRELFPEVENYAYSDMGPRGFRPVSLIEFCGWQDIDFSRVTVLCADMDCEAGPIDVDLTDEDRERVLELAATGIVTGKANATMTTGGTTAYWFEDEEGNYLGGLDLYSGLLVWNDGMYYIGD